MLLSAPALSSPLTFSSRTIDGRSTPMACATYAQTPVRLPARRPLRAPAQDTSWHGKPAVRMSTGPAAAQSAAVMSPKLGTSGKRWARIFAAPGSLSATQTSSPPRTDSTAMPRPS